MKVSELIEKLEKLRDEYGDVAVASYNTNCEDEGNVDRVEFCPEGKFSETYYCASQDGDEFNDQAYAVILSDSGLRRPDRGIVI